MFEKIREMVNNNNHTMAYVEGCKLLGLKDLAEELERIEGCMDHRPMLYDYYNAARHEAYKFMMRRAEQVMNRQVFEEFHNSF